MASSNNQPPAEDRLLTDEGFAAEIFWEKNRQTVLIAAAVIVLAVVGTIFWLVSSHNSKLASEALLAEAEGPDGWREVISRFPGSMPAADATFLLASSLREEGKFDESTSLYQKFLSEFPEHPLISGARLGIAENYSAAGKTNEVLAALKVVQTGGGYAAPYALLLEGRTLLRQGKLAEARDIFSKIVTSHQQSPAAQIAYRQVEEIEPLLAAQAQK